MYAMSGTNPDNWFANPRNDLTPLMSLDAGNLVRAFILSGSGLIPRELINKPAKAISLPISNFFLDNTMLMRLHLSAIIFTLSTSWSKFSAQTRISSTIFLAYGRTSSTVSECLHHSSDEELRPIRALRYRYLPDGRRNVVSQDDSSSRASWK